ncbi:glycine--lipid A transferase AlmG [Pseudoteredinibacter isoporae]
MSALIYKKRVKTMSQSIQQSFVHVEQDEARCIAKQSVEYQASGIVHCLDIPDMKYELVNSTRYFDLAEHLRERPAIFVSLHMGFADMPTYILNKMGIPTATLIGRGENTPAFNVLGCKILERLDIPYIKRGNNTMVQLLEEVSNGQSLIIHSDLRERGQQVSFLNRDTTVPTTAAALAVFSDAPLYFCYTIKESANSTRCQFYLSEIERPTGQGLSRKDIIATLTETITRKMQSTIHLHPEQWFWSYNRFK